MPRKRFSDDRSTSRQDGQSRERRRARSNMVEPDFSRLENLNDCLQAIGAQPGPPWIGWPNAKDATRNESAIHDKPDLDHADCGTIPSRARPFARTRGGTVLLLDTMAEALRDMLRAEAAASKRIARRDAHKALETYNRLNHWR